MTGLRVERAGSLEELRAEWEPLAARSGNVFATPEWHSLWWSHFGRGRRLELFAARDGAGALVAIVPLYRFAGRPLRVLRFVGHGPGDELGPVAADAASAREAFRLALAELGRWHVLVGEQLPGSWADLPGATVLTQEGSPVLRIEGRTWDEYLASRSSNFRSQVRSRERKLGREHALSFRRTERAEDLDADLDILFRLHEGRWAGGGSSFGGATEAFHRAFARCALERGWLRLWFLELDGVARAAWYGLRFGGADSYYQAGRDPEWGRSNVGFVLLAHSIRDAVESGRAEYRFLRGGEEYKYRFADEDPGLVTLGLTRGALGGAALRAAHLARRLRRYRAGRSASRSESRSAFETPTTRSSSTV